MSNRDIAIARKYHTATNHTLQKLRQETYSLDPANRPVPYKMYSSLAPLSLPLDFPLNDTSTFAAIASPGIPPSGEQLPDMQAIARLCFFSNGITKILSFADHQFAMRAAACTGALFHIELYLVCGPLPDLAAGIYHYSAYDHALRQLRAGDFRQVLVQATASEPSIAHAPVIVINTSTFWRNAYKYRSRAYRHAFWDDGTILANSLAIATELHLPASVVLAFVDEQVNALLDIDGEHEAAINLLALGHTDSSPPEAPATVPLSLPTMPLSAYEIEYPLITELHRESSLAIPEEVARLRFQPALSLPNPVLSPQSLVPLQVAAESALPENSLEAVIRRRGSTRRFNHEPIDLAQLSAILTHTLRGIPSDCLGPGGTTLSTLYLIVNAVEGLESGTYVFHQDQQALESLNNGNVRDMAKYLALGQDLGGDAAVNIYFLVDLEAVLAHFGNRGYRIAQLEAAITAGKIYLASYALALGATGLTFFDDDVTAFFSPHSAGKSVMFLIALGHPMKRA